MVQGWQRALLLLVAVGVFLALASPFIPDPLSIPGRNVVVFAICLMAMFLPHALLAGGSSPLVLLHETVEHGSSDRLALICSRLC
jgi:hypothetical protein